MTAPGRHPAPPRGGFAASLAIQRVSKNHTWLRLHRAKYDPLHFGTTRRGRFDAASGEFGVLYVARQIPGAFIETLVRDGVREISEARIGSFHVAEITVSRGLKFVDLAGKGLVRMGVDGRLNTGDYRVAQRWSSAFFAHPDKADGILYPSRHDPKQHLAALFDRAETLLTSKPCGTIRSYLGDREFYRLLDHYDIALL
ncbi:MAG: RES family NAD+ phosphorylase [Gammaproteobacteria bacterium]